MDLPVDRTIKRVEVTGLFGYYKYVIDHPDNDSASNPLLIIYGDNGSGKTTILKMIFYILSPLRHSGHKTKLAEIKFNSFKIVLNDDTVVFANRQNDSVTGSYELGISNGDDKFSVFLEVDKDGAIPAKTDTDVDKQYFIFLQKIKQLAIDVNFLSDDRKVLSFSENERLNQKRINQIRNQRLGFSDLTGMIDEEDEGSINHAIKGLDHWIKNNVLKGAKLGDENANTIYEKLIKQISKPKSKVVTAKETKQLLDKIKKINHKILDFYKSGLVSEIETGDFESALQTANQSNITLIYSILDPYIDGIQGRLDSLSDVQNILSKFLNNVNNYFFNKNIKYNIGDGFSLTNDINGLPIEFSSLSSGEKQLLQLFCNVITSSEKSTIFIIDEPEISLNVKWQRKLINTLLNFSANKNVQFIFASHSIELLSGHRKSVHRLQSI